MTMKMQVTPVFPGQVAAIAPISVSLANGIYTFGLNAGPWTITSASAAALSVGANGATSPVLQVDASAASTETGWVMAGAARGAGVTMSVISPLANENGTVKAKGSGSLILNGTANGPVLVPGRFLAIGSTAQALAPPNAGLWIDNGTLNITNSNTNIPLGDGGGIHIGIPSAKDQAPAGGNNGIKMFSNNANNPEAYMQFTLRMTTDPVVGNRRCVVDSIEQGSGGRILSLNESGGNVGVNNATPAFNLDIGGTLNASGAASVARLHTLTISNTFTNILESTGNTIALQFFQSDAAPSMKRKYIQAYDGGKFAFGKIDDAITTFTEQLVINNDSSVTFPGISTTASAANAFIDNAASNSLLRSTSSLKYKKDVEPIEDKYADAISRLAPIWYRSKASADNPDWSWYGLAAEDVAAIDPRLVHWAYPDDAWENVKTSEVVSVPDTEEVDEDVKQVFVEDGRAIEKLVSRRVTRQKHNMHPVFGPDGSPIMTLDNWGKKIQRVDAFPLMRAETVTTTKRRLKNGAKLVPDGVMYDRITVLLLQKMNRAA